MGRAGLIFFVHGLGGHPTQTWGRFPELIANDVDLSAIWEVGFFEYPTSLLHIPFITKSPSVNRLAEGLRTILDLRYPQHSRILIAAHSLGGLLAKRYLCNEVAAGRPLRSGKLVLFAVPNNGASLANVATLISWRHRQLAQLCRNSDFLEALNSEWHNRKLETQVLCTYVMGGVDQVVAPDSARGGPDDTRLRTDPEEDHRSLVKPAAPTDVAFLALKAAAFEVRSATGLVAADPPPVSEGAPHPTTRLPAYSRQQTSPVLRTQPDSGTQTLALMTVGFSALVCILFLAGLIVLVLQRVLPPNAFWSGLAPILLTFGLAWRILRKASLV